MKTYHYILAGLLITLILGYFYQINPEAPLAPESEPIEPGESVV